MRMEAAHHVADDLRALAMLRIGRQSLLPHRVQDAALDGFQSVADIGQRAGRDDRQRVVEVARLRRFMERDVADGAAAIAGGPANSRVNGRVEIQPALGRFGLVSFGH
jgi:hypothetical protein